MMDEPKFLPLTIKNVGKHPEFPDLPGEFAVFRGDQELSDGFGYPFRGTESDAKLYLEEILARYGA